MRNLWRRFTALMSAAAFAEANEHRTAIEIAREGNERTAAIQRPVRSTFRGAVLAPPAAGK